MFSKVATTRSLRTSTAFIWRSVGVSSRATAQVSSSTSSSSSSSSWGLDTGTQRPAATVRTISQLRFFSSSSVPPENPQATFQAQTPTELNLEMAQGIQIANQLILKHGVGKQRLKLLATATATATEELPLVLKWQRMMEIYLGAQLHVVAALGYETNEQGIMTYTQQLAHFIHQQDPETQERFRTVGRETWRGMLATAFALDEDTVLKGGDEELTIVDARNIVHKVASKLMEPAVLELVATRCAKLPAESDPQIEMGMKHQVIQDVVVNHVYLKQQGEDDDDDDNNNKYNSPSSKSLVEELGFGTGATGYATMQYVMAYHENDPLCMQYTSSAMIKIWHAAGLDLSQSPQAATLPMSLPSA